MMDLSLTRLNPLSFCSSCNSFADLGIHKCPIRIPVRDERMEEKFFRHRSIPRVRCKAFLVQEVVCVCRERDVFGHRRCCSSVGELKMAGLLANGIWLAILYRLNLPETSPPRPPYHPKVVDRPTSPERHNRDSRYQPLQNSPDPLQSARPLGPSKRRNL